jgi:hypothetical protein
MYSRNATRGQWGAHGRYLARETREADPKTVGFNKGPEPTDISKQLDAWQKAGDERMWKLIVSPEFGDRLDLKRLTTELMTRMGCDLSMSKLEWVAVAHYNTAHPHVHIAISDPLHRPQHGLKVAPDPPESQLPRTKILGDPSDSAFHVPLHHVRGPGPPPS